MPSIISRPTQTRQTTRGITRADALDLLDMIMWTSDDDLVICDDSARDSKDKAYARGERVRIAFLKYEIMPEGMTIQVMCVERDDKMWVAGVFMRPVA